MLPLKLLTGGNRVVTLTFVASATSTSSTVTIPATAQEGDLAILADCAVNTASSLPTSVIPSGWTSIRSDNGFSQLRAICSGKILSVSDPGASIAGMAGTYSVTKTLLVFRGSKAVSSFAAASTAGEVTTGDPAAQVVTSSSGSTPLIVIGTMGSTTGAGAMSFTPTADGEVTVSISGGVRQRTKYLMFAVTPSDVTVDMGSTGGLAMQSFYVSVT